jgi:hypothetical protein
MASKKYASPAPSSRPVTGCLIGGIYTRSKTIRLVVPCVTCISRNLFSFVSPPTWDAGSDVKTREAVMSISCRTCKELPDCRLRVFVRYFPGYGSLHVYPSDVWPYLLGRTKLGPGRHSPSSINPMTTRHIARKLQGFVGVWVEQEVPLSMRFTKRKDDPSTRPPRLKPLLYAQMRF